MIGQNAITKATQNVIVVVGLNPSWFDGKDQGDIPMVYTQKSRPKPNDLAILKGKRVQLIHANGTDELFAKWYVNIANTMPSQLIALDSSGEIFCG
jgi:hypothetical protein